MGRLYAVWEEFGPLPCWQQGHAWLPCLARDVRKMLRE